MKYDISKYENIINLPPPKSKKRKPMAAEKRAAQFAPFAAVTGYDASVQEAARLTTEKIELDEGTKEYLNLKLQFIETNSDSDYEVSITYFVPDTKKSGGKYVVKTGVICKIREYERDIVMEDGTQIPIDEVLTIEGDCFFELEFM